MIIGHCKFSEVEDLEAKKIKFEENRYIPKIRKDHLCMGLNKISDLYMLGKIAVVIKVVNYIDKKLTVYHKYVTNGNICYYNKLIFLMRIKFDKQRL